MMYLILLITAGGIKTKINFTFEIGFLNSLKFY